jgi:hypothetical protein
LSSKPYVTIAFVNRNDGYGGDLEARIEKFIDYYARYATRNLLEFVICDWNPPADRPKLRDAFPWQKLQNVLHVEVPEDVHARIAGQRGRKMLDYIGRNVAIRRGRGEFSLVINQDIFISDSIMRRILRRRLDPRAFYRADRCDFNFERCRDEPPESFEQAALENVFLVNRRHSSTDAPISVPVDPATIDQNGSAPERGDWYDEAGGIIHCQRASLQRRRDRTADLCWRWLPRMRPGLLGWRAPYLESVYHRDFLLHTNASGDFLLVPRRAFDRIHGMWETTEIYLHLDSYAVAQLFAAGYEQRIFRQPHRVFHADHDRSARLGFAEGMTWDQHEAKLSDIIRGTESYQLNGPDWGLGKERLPTWRL